MAQVAPADQLSTCSDFWSDYDKRPGAGNIHGHEYEYKMCYLLFLRGIRSGRFHLAANDNEAGAFDDVVYHQHSLAGDSRAYFIQLKHKLNNKQQPRQALLSVISRNDFSLLKYFLSYRDDMAISMDSPLYDYSLVIYTNAEIEGQPQVSEFEDKLLISNKNGVMFSFKADRDKDVFSLADHIGMFRQFLQDLLKQLEGVDDVSIAVKERVTAFMKDYEARYLREKFSGSRSIWEMGNRIKRNPNLEKIKSLLKLITDLGDLSGYVPFLEKLKMCTQQVSVKEIDSMIKEELNSTLGVTPKITESVFHKLRQKIEDWWKGDSGCFLTEEHPLWNEVVSCTLQKVNKRRLNQLSKLKIEFNEKEFRPIQDRLSNNQLILTVVMGKKTDLSVLKVVRMLQRMYRRFLLGPSDSALRFWTSRWCNLLVLDCLNKAVGVDFFYRVATILQSNREKKLVVITRHSERFTIATIRGLAPTVDFVEEIDDINLTSLNTTTQQEVLATEVDYQGYRVSINDLIGDHQQDNENVCYILDMLKELSNRLYLLQNRLELDDVEDISTFVEELAYRRKSLHLDIEFNGEIKSSIVWDLMVDEAKLSPMLNNLTNNQEEIKKALLGSSVVRSLKIIKNNLQARKSNLGVKSEESTDILLVMINDLLDHRDFSQRVDDPIQSNMLMHITLEEDNICDYLKGLTGRYILKRRKINSVVRKLSQDMELMNKLHNILEIKEAMNPLLSQLNDDVAYLDLLYCREMLKYALNADFLVELSKDHKVKIGDALQPAIANYIPRTLWRDKLVRPETAMDILDRVAVIVGEPGMGKSTFLTHVALNTKAIDPKVWVLRVNLNTMSYYLNSINIDRFTLENCIEFLVIAAGVKELFEILLLENSLKTSGKIIVFFDGFDEIYPLYIDQMNCIIRELKCTKCSKIWITSRPYLKSDLEECSASVPFSINQFSVEDQKTFLRNIWRERNIQVDDAYIFPFIDEVLKLMPVSSTAEMNFMGIPLQTMMVADVFERGLMSDQSTPAELDFTGLYEMFFNKKCDIYFKERRRDDIHNPEVIRENERTLKEIEENHKVAALALLFSHEDLITLHDKGIEEKACKFLESTNQSWPAIGIINMVEDGKPQFLHRTIAEFLVGKWLQENYLNNRDFLENILFSEYYSFIRRMFDGMLSRTFAMHTAVLNSNVHGLHVDKESVNAVDSGGRTLLHLLATYSQSMGADKLLEHLLITGADANILDNVLQWTPINYANKVRNWGAVELLLKNMSPAPKLCFEADAQLDALKSACTNGYLELMKYLVREGVDMNMTLNDTLPLQLAIEDNQAHIVDYLLNTARDDRYGMGRVLWKVVDVKKKNSEGMTVLHCAVAGRRLYISQLLIDAGCDVNAGDRKKKSPLHYSAREGDLYICMLLIRAGGKVNAVDRWQKTPLHHAVANGHLEVVELLVEEGGNVDAVDANNKTPLHYAVEHDRNAILEFLLQYGSNVNAVEKYNKTPLHLAVQRGSLSIVNTLIKAGCNVEVRSLYGLTALDYAYKDDNMDKWMALVGAGCKIQMSSGTHKVPRPVDQTENYYETTRRGSTADRTDRRLLDTYGQLTSSNRLKPTQRWFKTPLDEILFGDQMIQHDFFSEIEPFRKNMFQIRAEQAFKRCEFTSPRCTVRRYNPCDERLLPPMRKGPDDVCRLLQAAWTGDLCTVRALVAAGTDVNACDPYSRKTALHNCAEQGHLDVAVFLLDRRADAARADYLSRTPLDLAVAWRHSQLARLLQRAVRSAPRRRLATSHVVSSREAAV